MMFCRTYEIEEAFYPRFQHTILTQSPPFTTMKYNSTSTEARVNCDPETGRLGRGRRRSRAKYMLTYDHLEYRHRSKSKS